MRSNSITAPALVLATFLARRRYLPVSHVAPGLAHGNRLRAPIRTTDASGGLSLTEVQAAMPDVTTEAFATADADVSSELSEEEYATLALAM